MPNRILRADILRSEAVDKLSLEAEVFYRRLMSVADDEGRYYGNVTMLWTAAYPLKADRITREQVSVWLEETVMAGLIILYEVDGKRFIQLEKFRQQVRIASKFPAVAKALIIKCVAAATQLSSNGVANDTLLVSGLRVTGYGLEEQLCAATATQLSSKGEASAALKNSEPSATPPERLSKGKAVTVAEILKELGPLYPGVDMESEHRKMQAWKTIPRNSKRSINRQFIVNWLNKVEAPVADQAAPTAPMANGASTTASWAPPSYETVRAFSDRKKWAAGFARQFYDSMVSHNWRHYGQPVISDEHWQSLMRDADYKP